MNFSPPVHAWTVQPDLAPMQADYGLSDKQTKTGPLDGFSSFVPTVKYPKNLFLFALDHATTVICYDQV